MHRFRNIATALAVAASLIVAPVSSSASVPAPLTNLAHLNFLTASMAPPAQAKHNTYRLDSEPAIGVL